MRSDGTVEYAQGHMEFALPPLVPPVSPGQVLPALWPFALLALCSTPPLPLSSMDRLLPWTPRVQGAGTVRVESG